MHTNLDNAQGGVNFKIAEKLGLTNTLFMSPSQRLVAQQPVVCGSGVVGELTDAMDSQQFIELVKQTFQCGCIMTNELLQRQIRKVAICGGSGAFLLSQAITSGADAFITGEMHYHEYFDCEQKIQILVIGHYESEHFTTEIFHHILSSHFPSLPLFIAQTNTNPIVYHT